MILTPIKRVNGDLPDLGVAVLLPEGLDFLLNRGNLLSKGRLEIRGIAALRDRLSGGRKKLLNKKPMIKGKYMKLSVFANGCQRV